MQNNENSRAQNLPTGNEINPQRVIQVVAENNPNQRSLEIQQPRRRRSSRFYPSSCCFCFRIHQGFINIVYLDIARFFWGKFISNQVITFLFLGIIFSVMVYSKSTSTTIDYVASSLTLFAIILQSMFAIISVRKALPVNNYVIYRRYFYCKVFYLLAAFFENVIKTIIVCKTNLGDSSGGDDDDDCSSSSLSGQLALIICWLTIETYFAYIVYIFYKKTTRGDYGPIGDRPNYGDQLSNFSGNQDPILEAIAVEVFGFTVKSPEEVEDSQGVKALKYIKTSIALTQDPRISSGGLTIFKQKTKHGQGDVVLMDLTEEQEDKKLIGADPQNINTIVINSREILKE